MWTCRTCEKRGLKFLAGCAPASRNVDERLSLQDAADVDPEPSNKYIFVCFVTCVVLDWSNEFNQNFYYFI